MSESKMLISLSLPLNFIAILEIVDKTFDKSQLSLKWSLAILLYISLFSLVMQLD